MFNCIMCYSMILSFILGDSHWLVFPGLILKTKRPIRDLTTELERAFAKCDEMDQFQYAS